MNKSDAICEMTFQCSKELKDFSDTDNPHIKFCSDRGQVRALRNYYEDQMQASRWPKHR